MKCSLGISNLLEEISSLSLWACALLHSVLQGQICLLLQVFLDFLLLHSSPLILLFSSVSLQWLLRMAFLSLLAILWNSAFKWVYLSFSPLPFASLLFTAICKASSDSHFAFLPFFFLEMVLFPVFYTMSWTSVHSSSGTLSIRSNPLNLSLTSTV